VPQRSVEASVLDVLGRSRRPKLIDKKDFALRKIIFVAIILLNSSVAVAIPNTAEVS
jgi:hypothetical protein